MNDPTRRAPRPAFAPVSPEDQARIKALEEEIDGFKGEMLDCGQQARELRARELAGEGIFSAEIFVLQQRKMTLTTEIQHRKVLINHLLWEGGA